MLERFITASFKKPLVAMVLALAGAAVGAMWMRDLPRDVFPDLLGRDAALYGYRLSATEGLWWIDTLADLRRVETLWEGGPQP